MHVVSDSSKVTEMGCVLGKHASSLSKQVKTNCDVLSSRCKKNWLHYLWKQGDNNYEDTSMIADIQFENTIALTFSITSQALKSYKNKNKGEKVKNSIIFQIYNRPCHIYSSLTVQNHRKTLSNGFLLVFHSINVYERFCGYLQKLSETSCNLY